MPIGNLDDQLHSHPKPEVAGLEAMGLWALALSYCLAYTTDGRITRDRAERIAGRRTAALASRLCEAALWYLANAPCKNPSCSKYAVAGDGWRVHDWEEHQKTRAQVEAERERKSVAGKRGGLRRAENQAAAEAVAQARASAPATTEADTDAQPEIAVLLPEAAQAHARALSLSSGSDLDSGSGSPALDLLKLSGSDARQTNPRANSGRGKGVQKPKTECPSSVDLGAAEWLRGHGIPLGVEANKMLDHHVANGIQRRDWPATWRNWNVRSAEYGAKNGGSSRPHGAHDIQSEPDYDHERERQTREAHLAEAAAKTAAYEADCVARGVSPVPF